MCQKVFRKEPGVMIAIYREIVETAEHEAADAAA
jgi:hypothetical protein